MGDLDKKRRSSSKKRSSLKKSDDKRSSLKKNDKRRSSLKKSDDKRSSLKKSDKRSSLKKNDDTKKRKSLVKKDVVNNKMRKDNKNSKKKNKMEVESSDDSSKDEEESEEQEEEEKKMKEESDSEESDDKGEDDKEEDDSDDSDDDSEDLSDDSEGEKLAFRKMIRKHDKSSSTRAGLRKYINHQRTLIVASRGCSHLERHLQNDLAGLMPHSKTDAKFDAKKHLRLLIELSDMRNCNNCMYFENRKRKDLYMWLARIPTGASIKFLVQSIVTMDEIKLNGNCLKGSRALLNFDSQFDEVPHFKLMKEMLVQTFGTPKAHPKSKPFIDHVISFSIVDNRIWFRNYQIVYDNAELHSKNTKKDPVLVEIGPRFILNPIRIFARPFGGQTLWVNPHYISPNTIRSTMHLGNKNKYTSHKGQKDKRKKYKRDHPIPKSVYDNVYE